jgi:hypothetical protein
MSAFEPLSGHSRHRTRSDRQRPDLGANAQIGENGDPISGWRISRIVLRGATLGLRPFLNLSFPTPGYEPNNRLVALSHFLPSLIIPI